MVVHSRVDGPEFTVHRSRTKKIASWRERQFHACEAFSRTERNYDARSNRSVPVENILHPTAGDPELTEKHGDHDGQEGEHDAEVLAPLFSSADRRFRKWEDVVVDSFACNYRDHPVRRRDEIDSTAVELAVLHHELAVDPLRWFADIAMQKHWHSSDAVDQQLQGLI